jgi:hypothetical protein
VQLDFCPDFELRMRRRHSTLERGQELGHVFDVALGHERDAQTFMFAPRGLLTVDRAVVSQPTLAAP